MLHGLTRATLAALVGAVLAGAAGWAVALPAGDDGGWGSALLFSVLSGLAVVIVYAVVAVALDRVRTPVRCCAGVRQRLWRRRMKIGLLLAESRGGIGQHVASLVPRYLAAGHEVVVCAPPGTAEHFDFGDADRRRTRRPALRGSDVIHAHGYRAGMAALRDRSQSAAARGHLAQRGDRPGPRGLVMRLGQRLVATGPT